MSVSKGSDVVILDLEDASNIAEAYRMAVMNGGAQYAESLRNAGVLESCDRLLKVVRQMRDD
jgi:hypothetical protein